MPALFVEDVCGLKGKHEEIVGIVEVTHTDVDSHSQAPYEDIKRDRNVTQKDFREFLATGIPPKDVVLIHWVFGRDPVFELIPSRKLILRDRSFLVGDVVKKSTQNPISGVVTQVKIKCSLRTAKSGLAAWHRTAVLDPELVPTSNLSADRTLGAPRPVYDNISAEELRLETIYNEGDIILYKNWVGRIEEVMDEIHIRLSDGSIVVPEDDENIMVHSETGYPATSDRILPGMIVRTKKSFLRRGRWIFGKYDANVAPMGLVLHIRTVLLNISWLCRRLDGQGAHEISPEPLDQLTVDEFESDDFHIYNRHRRPINPETTDDGSLLINTFEDLVVGTGVRFRDPQSVAELHKEIELIPRTETSGYDVNAFSVSKTATHVRVLWQDLTVTEHESIDLLPDASIEDENEVWPGEIVVTNERQKANLDDWIFQPAKVGVVQSVNAEERIARVRWLPGASLLYHDQGDLDDFLGHSLLPGSTTGTRSNTDPQEDVPIYDIRPASGVNRRRGDFVMLLTPDSPNASASAGELNWFGEVIHLNLDGLLTVRLGGLSEVRDVRIAPELTTLAYSSDMFDDGMESEDSEDMSEDALDEDSDDDTDGWIPEEEARGISDQMTRRLRAQMYQHLAVNGFIPPGEVISPGMLPSGDVNEDGNEDDEEWETEGEESDELNDDESIPDLVMRDAPHENPDVEKEATETSAAPMISDSTPRVSMANVDALIPDNLVGMPENFTILDGAPPQSHFYREHPSEADRQFLKAVQKEHRILKSSLPAGVFVRTWESRLDLLRLLLIGPIGTPYEYAPFLIDLHLPSDYPAAPPKAHFHSWTQGQGAINPNLYENGKICLSLLGTWHAAEKGATWNPQKSTLLQVVVSILGLVLVKDPYFNEAGYEVRVGSADSSVASRLYSERTYFKARGFITQALKNKPEGLEDVVDWLYGSDNTRSPCLLQRAIRAAEALIEGSIGTASSSMASGEGSVARLSKGAQIMLQRQIVEMKGVSTSTSSASPSFQSEHLNTEYLRVDATKLGISSFNVEDWDLKMADTDDALRLQKAADALRSSDIPVAFPTETVYGLGAVATRSSAVKGIYQAKQRPSDNPLIVHFASLAQLRKLYQASPSCSSDPPSQQQIDAIPAIYKSLIEKFWPGPLTIILPLPEPSPLAPEVTAGLNTFGARIPKNLLALALIKLTNEPVAAPSANASTKPSPTAAEHVYEDLNGRIRYIIDDGPCDVGVESTVVDGLISPPAILRPGGISIEQVRACPGWENVTIAYKNVAESGTTPRAPGMKYRHYSPKAKVILVEGEMYPPEVECFGAPDREMRVGIVRTRNWGPIYDRHRPIDPDNIRTQPSYPVLWPTKLDNNDPDAAAAAAADINPTTPSTHSLNTFAKLSPSLASSMLRQIPTSTAWTLLLPPLSDPSGPSTISHVFDIGLGGKTEDIARGLFSALRELDRKGVEVIYVEGIDDAEGDLAGAVMNRLRKAAEEVWSSG